ncbi:hypothetical protein WM40_01175 [Robbsia andropogonis]|uniref:Peptidase M16 C-terminal domain-containing protein n=1 Tax=Robbsia andropogonis TaxID=28092 RepID=A0A0F5K559_9BURK|nr:insulinase family protein [Robbsia andropogonis]KKB65261.1 hypothetical protein WM40_01175 [Robbsia andropogonis]
MIEQWTSASGVVVYFVPRREVPIVDINIDFAAGSVFDPPGKSGLADLLASVLLTGQKAYRATGPFVEETLPAMREEVAEHAFDMIGAKVAADAQADRLSVGLRALSHPVLLRRAVTLLTAMLAVPSWAARPIARERERLLAAAEEQLIDPEQLANLRLTQALYGDHPYGRLPDVASLEDIETADLRAFHRRYLTRERAVITVVGDLSMDDARAMAEQLGARCRRPCRRMRHASRGTANTSVAEVPRSIPCSRICSSRQVRRHGRARNGSITRPARRIC